MYTVYIYVCIHMYNSMYIVMYTCLDMHMRGGGLCGGGVYASGGGGLTSSGGGGVPGGGSDASGGV